ncbi:MAG: nicotinate-nucleotide diphosphorylase (carboxylating) [Planctomycetes bacterium]|nr:nicotinate-nucleotide diphosphorylase (carboxylating) [Planctomycetota bacterium]MBV21652.1 nicotinate-nucleotide diphosphorylase (carboxylating) [Planctomycetaceae bacterium]
MDGPRLDEVIAAALAEDRGAGDVTSEGLLPAASRARARLVARDAGVLAGIGVFARTFELCDPQVDFTLAAQDGERVEPDQELAICVGAAASLLLAERTALNLLQRMSGIATETARFVAAAAGQARILDTRKTTPGLRILEKYAVRCGGGENHRFGLFDEAMIKENHLALAGCDLEQALERLRREVGTGVRITAEASDKEEACAAVRGGADVILLDNFSPEGLLDLCPLLRDQARDLGREVELEASGGIRLETVAAFATTGVERLSIGALTHSVQALDLSLYLEPLSAEPEAGP